MEAGSTNKNEGPPEYFNPGGIILAVACVLLAVLYACWGIMAFLLAWIGSDPSTAWFVPKSIRGTDVSISNILDFPVAMVVGGFKWLSIPGAIFSAIHFVISMLLGAMRNLIIRGTGKDLLPNLFLYSISSLIAAMISFYFAYWMLYPSRHWLPFILVTVLGGVVLLVSPTESKEDAQE